MVSCACRLGPPSSLVPALGAGQPPLAGCVTTYINVPSCLRILNVFLKCAPPGPSTGIMRKFHGRWQIRPHPRDPEHASMSTLDQVGAQLPGAKQGGNFAGLPAFSRCHIGSTALPFRTARRPWLAQEHRLGCPVGLRRT